MVLMIPQMQYIGAWIETGNFHGALIGLQWIISQLPHTAATLSERHLQIDTWQVVQQPPEFLGTGHRA